MNTRYRKTGVGVHIKTLTKRGHDDEIVWATQNFSSCK